MNQRPVRRFVIPEGHKLQEPWCQVIGGRAFAQLHPRDHVSCLHFVARIAELGGLRVDYPAALIRHPKAFLNRVATLNPQLGARPLR